MMPHSPPHVKISEIDGGDLWKLQVEKAGPRMPVYTRPHLRIAERAAFREAILTKFNRSFFLARKSQKEFFSLQKEY